MEKRDPKKSMMCGQIFVVGRRDNEIEDAIYSTDRALYLPDKYKHIAYTDCNVISKNCKSIAPTNAYPLLLAARAEKNVKTLVIASGGYFAELCSKLYDDATILFETPEALELAKSVNNIHKNISGTLTCNFRQVAGQRYNLAISEGAIKRIPKCLLDIMQDEAKLVLPIAEAQNGLDGNVLSKVFCFYKKDGGVSKVEQFTGNFFELNINLM